MNTDRYQQIKKIFRAACEGDSAARQAVLEEACADDAALRSEVESLLAHFDSPTIDLDHAASEVSTFLYTQSSGSNRAGALPERIGSYRILRLLGEGGMGVVYLAQQENPRRTVALKVLRFGFAGRGMRRRFEHETAVLGRLQHPGIAQIFEAGTAETGFGSQPYFAMEYVEGKPLLDFVEEKGLADSERIEAVIGICEAVQHAHQKGVIHRDLKPGNILMADESSHCSNRAVKEERLLTAAAQPKILDFGIARSTDTDLLTTTLRTEAGELIGTLPYMSPEQVVGDPDGVDTRSDVYSLGVILYELLSGELPYDLDGNSVAEAARVIGDQRPVPLNGRETRFRGDLDIITATALAGEKQRRYQTPAVLADDLRRFLEQEPIHARRDSIIYLLGKRMRRYRAAFAAAAVFVLLLIAFALFATVQAKRQSALAAREEAVNDRLDAELTASNIERGRLFSSLGNLTAAEELLWPAYLRDPDSPHAKWALWEHYADHPYLATLDAHEGRARRVVYTHDGAFLISAGDDGYIRYFDADSYERVRAIPAHDEPVHTLAISTHLLASSGVNGKVIVRDVSTGEKLHEFQAHDNEITNMYFTPKGDRLATGSQTGQLRVWDTHTFEIIREVQAEVHTIWGIDFTSDGKYIGVAGKLGVEIRDAETLALQHLDSAYGGLAASIRFLPGDASYATTCKDRSIQFHRTDTGELIDQQIFNNGTMNSLTVLKNHNPPLLLAGGWWSIEIWNAHIREHIRSIPVRSTLHGMNVHPDHTHLATAHADGSIHVVELDPTPGASELPGHANRVAATCDEAGRWIATGDNDGIIRLWDARTYALRRSWPGHTGRVRTLVFNSTGALLLTGGLDHTIAGWDVDTGEQFWSFDDFNYGDGGGATSRSICFDLRDETFFYSSRRGDLVQRVAATGEEILRRENLGRELLTVGFHPGGDLFAATIRDDDFRVRLLNPDGQPLPTLQAVAAPWELNFSPDGRLLAVGTWGSTIEVWNVDQHRREAILKGHRGTVWSIDFHPANPDLLASSGADGTVRLWDVPSRRNVYTWRPFDSDIVSLNFSHDGSKLFAAGADDAAHILDLHYFDRHIHNQRGHFAEVYAMSEELGALHAGE